ncbi:GntR family transcriptional regulator [uncultured Victivallis sp.]|uniref:GntR family transcriptional regulator n=1 Tax=uncultured Victivallis sp. TaxID=354118 RepID=UPI0025E6EA89|nr:GntR family transcriptional regulator [uncultured Victivallis sp.]
MALAPYQRVYETLLTEIRERKLVPGIALPGENSLSETYRVSRPTLRRALQLLATEGYLECRAGIGWSILTHDPKPQPERDRELVIGVDVVSDDWGAFYYEPFLRGMRRSAGNRRCRLQLIQFDSENGIRPGPVDALALVKAQPADFQTLAGINETTPVVLLNRMPPQPDLSYFSADYRVESKRVVEYLLQIGHRRIAVISNSKLSESSRAQFDVCAQRIDGWRDAFRDEELEPPEELNCRDHSIGGIERFLREQRPTAVFATIGCCVMPTLLAAERAQMRIPGELSLFSFDDMGAATLPDVPISCVKMPLETMGELAVDFLSSRCDDPENTPPVHRIMSSALVINDSCRKLPRR